MTTFGELSERVRLRATIAMAEEHAAASLAASDIAHLEAVVLSDKLKAETKARELAEATNRELADRLNGMEHTLARQAASAKAGMDAATQAGKWQMEEARRLKSECSPASVASQREANETLTAELEAANAEIKRLRLLCEEAIDDIEDWGGYASSYFKAKHDLYGNVSRLRAALGGSNG